MCDYVFYCKSAILFLNSALVFLLSVQMKPNMFHFLTIVVPSSYSWVIGVLSYYLVLFLTFEIKAYFIHTRLTKRSTNICQWYWARGSRSSKSFHFTSRIFLLLSSATARMQLYMFLLNWYFRNFVLPQETLILCNYPFQMPFLVYFLHASTICKNLSVKKYFFSTQIHL